MANIRVSCPTCKSELEIDEQHTGLEVECGSCMQVFVALQEHVELPVATLEEQPASGSRRGSSRRDNDDGDRDRDRGRSRRRRRRDDDDDYDYAPRRQPKSRLAYILFGVLLGEFGAHNFYAGYTNTAVAQLIITLVSIPLMCVFVGFITIFISPIWAIVDVCTIDTDSDGYKME